MRNFCVNLILFIALAFAFSALTACPTTSSRNDSVEDSKTNTTESKKDENSAQPPAALMQTEIKTLDGAAFKLADKKGKVVLVNLWATWCGPCREEMPALVEMQEKYKDKNFEIIGLDVDREETAEQINGFAKKMKLNYQLGWANDAFLTGFHNVTKEDVIPQTILFNREGNMTAVFIGGGAKNIVKMKESVEKTVNQQVSGEK